ncbi:cupin domain-containing protein [Cupriavidus alkaliphilus]|uniref:cupin domain-containing protein n=1 Tax=Cupriavidus alkaliphilus TaxID=942866 RepID=UPI000DC43A27|nr:ester cyclase [Cupriavidus alkaliphilus]RAS09412.1 steroid delta-isomerase-like uncharacterized protein [Cupriavidus alkaliphilus]
MSTPQEPSRLQGLRERIVRDHFADEVRQDFDAVLSTFPHPHYELIPTGNVFDGNDEVRRYYSQSRQAFPDQRSEIIQLRHTDDAVIVEFWLLGTHRGTLNGLPATGNAFRCRMIALFLFEGETLICERIYFDSLTMMQQLLSGLPAELQARAVMGMLSPKETSAPASVGTVAKEPSTLRPPASTQQDRLLTLNTDTAPRLPTEVPGVTITPLFLDREHGTWVLYGRFEPGTILPKHFHTGTVHFYTTRGMWQYAEYPDDPQTAGSYLYEPGGSIHTFTVPADATEAAEGFMVVHGANVNFVGDNYHSIMDAGAIETAILGAVSAGMMPMPRYIRPNGGAAFSAPPA